jgi:hypothetical protein
VVPEVGSSTLPQPSVITLRGDDSESEDETTHSDDTEGLRKAARDEKRDADQPGCPSSNDRNTYFGELQAVAKKEIADDKAEEERRLRGERGMAKPVDRDQDLRGDRGRNSDATMADKISSRLQLRALWNKVSMEHINANADWSICNAPDSEKLILCQTTLVDARVFDVATWRKVVEEAYVETRAFERNRVHQAMPPRCQLVESLYASKDSTCIHEDEINLIIEFDGLIAYDLDEVYVIAITIGFYAMPVLREISAKFGSGTRVEDVETDTGAPPIHGEKMYIKAFGNFLCHADQEESGCNRRSERVHDLYVAYEKSVTDIGQAECLEDILSGPIVRGFTHEGAAEICHQTQLEAMSEDRKQFYPEGKPPTNKAEYTDIVRDLRDILVDPWFTEENGRPSITALLRSLMVGDFVLAGLGDAADTWQESYDHVVQNAVPYDGQAIDPPICANKGWAMEMMSLERPNIDRISSWETPSEQLSYRDRVARDQFRNALDRCLTGNMRHHGVQAPELDRNPPPGRSPVRKINMDAGGWARLKDLQTYLDGEGLENERDNRCRAARKKGGEYRSALVPCSQRRHHNTIDDILQVVINSSKDRYRCVTQTNPCAGVRVPCWLGCKRGHSIKTVNPMRTALLLTFTDGFETIKMVGQVTHKTNDVAVAGILGKGLRNDAGDNEGRSGVMCDP